MKAKSRPGGESVIAGCILALAATLVQAASPSPEVLSLEQEFVLEFERGGGGLTQESRALLAVLSGCSPSARDEFASGSQGAATLQQKFFLQFDPQGAGLTTASRALLAVLTGCSKGAGSYVVLLPSPDGTVGRLVVQNERGEQQALSEARTGMKLDGTGSSFAVSSEQLKRDFGSTMSALPALPEQFQLYFKLGSTELTEESKTLIPRILQTARERERVVEEGSAQRGTVDISVIGHTDTLGRPEENIILGFRRAGVIAGLLQRPGSEKLSLSVESHGERNPLVLTPDEVAEPRNRRVEVTLR